MGVNKMRKGIVTTIVGVAALNLISSVHYISRHSEQRKIDNIPQVVQQTEKLQALARSYFYDGFVTPEEGNNLYWICNSANDSGTLRDSQNLMTQEGTRISSELFEMRNEFRPEQNRVAIRDHYGRSYEIMVAGKDMFGSDLATRLDELLRDYITYLQTSEYRNLVRPLKPQERLERHIVAFLSG